MNRLRHLHLLGLLCLFAASAFAQKYTVKNIVFDGVVPYAQADLELASGLKTGDLITSAVLQDAAQRLVNTGAFGDIQATVDGPIKAVTVIFKVLPASAARMVVPHFENFVWWQPEELTVELHKRVPLFNGTLPEAGNLQQAVQDALQQMLHDKQITAKIDSRIIHPGLGHPKRVVAYSITSPDIRFASVTIDGVSPNNAAAIGKLTASFAGRPYSESSVEQVATLYKNAGALDAKLSNITRTLAMVPSRINVTVTATLTAGAAYHVSSLDFAGTPLVSKEQFTAEQKLHPGDLASQAALLKSLLVIDDAYRKLGYLDADIEAVPTIDVSSHQVAYVVSTVPGEQYKINTLTLNNLTPEQRQQFNSFWKLQVGTLYDSVYTATFLKHTGIASLETYSAGYTADADPDTHLVDLTINFFFARDAD